MNRLLNEGISNAGIARSIMDVGGALDPRVIARHKSEHWTKPVPQDAPQPTKRDLAVMVREKVADMVQDMSPDALLMMGKEVAPMIGKGLQAEAIIDKRLVDQRKLGLAAGALSIQAWLAGMGDTTKPPPELDDGNTIEGEATEVLHSPGEDGPRSEE